ncbi:MAG: PorT family protein [Marinilabiliaceae bacterium]|nr:PorT family protein [Marinilabiliaceae bacterium]
MIKRSYLITMMILPMLLVAQNQKEYTIITVEQTPSRTETRICGINLDFDTFGDTLTKITIGNKSFEIIENVYDNPSTTKVRVVHSPRNQFKGHWGGVGIGFNNFFSEPFNTVLPKDADFLELNMNKSVEVALNLFQHDISLSKNRNNFGLITGVGLTLSNYRFNDLVDQRIKRISETKQLGTIPLPRTIEAKKNKMLVRTITVPLLLEIQAPDNNNNPFYINAGVYGGLNFSSHVKVKYIDNVKQKFHEDYNVNLFKYGAMVRTGYRWLNLYATCDLSQLFQKGRAPEIYSWSIGIMLVDF